jgi:Tol biopolymer transport system component
LHIVETHSGGADIRLDARESADWSWSPDGRTLAYTDGAGQLAIFDVAARSNQVLVPAEESAWGKPIWSADGQRIICRRQPAPTAGGPTLRQGLWRVLPPPAFEVELTRT